MTNKYQVKFGEIGGTVGRYYESSFISSQEKANAARIASTAGFVDFNKERAIEDLEKSSKVATSKRIAFDAANSVDLSGSSLAILQSQIEEFEYGKIMEEVNASLTKIDIEYQATMQSINAKNRMGQARASFISSVGSSLAG